MRTATTGTIAERMTTANNLSLVKLSYSRSLLEHKPLMLTDRTVRSARETAPHGNRTGSCHLFQVTPRTLRYRVSLASSTSLRGKPGLRLCNKSLLSRGAERAGTRHPDRPYLLLKAETGFPHSEVQRMKSPEIALNDSETKSVSQTPIISPDLENGRGVLDFPLTIRGGPLKIPSCACPSKPVLRPESIISPGNPARQEIVPWGGGVLHSAPGDARVVFQATGW